MRNQRRRIRLLPYKMASESGRNLARQLNILRVRTEESKFRARTGDVIINWGNSAPRINITPGHSPTILNKNGVDISTDKLRTFEHLNNEDFTNIPDYTTDINIAKYWLDNDICKRVFIRTKLNGHSGEGIIVARSSDEVIDAPLYVKGIAKEREFRIHVLNGEVIDYSEKKARNGARELDSWNPDIRSYDNGWIFARENVEVPQQVLIAAINSVRLLGLDFAAVDICIDKHNSMPVVLELNSSPALEGTTLDSYTTAFVKYFNGEL